MAQMTFRIFRLTDRQLLSAFDKLRADFQGAQQASAQIAPGSSVQAIDVSLPVGDQRNEALEEILAVDSAISSGISMSLQESCTVSVSRSGEAGVDQCSVAYPDRCPPSIYVRLMAACHRQLPAFDRGDAPSRLFGAELAEFYTRREQTVLRLEALSEKLIEQNSNYRREVDRETTSLRERLQADADAAREKLRLEYESKEADFKARETAFETRAKALDDRRATHARRAIRDEMKRRIEDRGKSFSLTSTTVRKRLPNHALFVLMILTFAAVLSWGIWDVLTHGARWESTPYDWFRLLRIPLGVVGLAGFVVYYIRWNDQWFREHAEEEFRLKRLDLDIDRASWMVEMMLEWKEEKDSPIPAELIDRLSRNLFAADGKERPPAQHPALRISPRYSFRRQVSRSRCWVAAPRWMPKVCGSFTRAPQIWRNERRLRGPRRDRFRRMEGRQCSCRVSATFCEHRARVPAKRSGDWRRGRLLFSGRRRRESHLRPPSPGPSFAQRPEPVPSRRLRSREHGRAQNISGDSPAEHQETARTSTGAPAGRGSERSACGGALAYPRTDRALGGLGERCHGGLDEQRGGAGSFPSVFARGSEFSFRDRPHCPRTARVGKWPLCPSLCPRGGNRRHLGPTSANVEAWPKVASRKHNEYLWAAAAWSKIPPIRRAVARRASDAGRR